MPVFYTEINGGTWRKLSDVVVLPKSITNSEEISKILLKEGVPIVKLPEEIIDLIQSLGHKVNYLSPLLVKRYLTRAGNHPYLLNKFDVFVLLEYFLKELNAKVSIYVTNNNHYFKRYKFFYFLLIIL